MFREVILPILSAIIGTAVAWQLKDKCARWVPVHFGAKDKEQLLKQYGRNIKFAHGLTVLGFCVGVLPYFDGRMSNHDWRGLGIAFGLACFLPLAYFVAVNAKKGDNAIRENLIAYAMWQRTPPRLLYSLMGIACVVGVVSAVCLFW